jgi:hypothetical protein
MYDLTSMTYATVEELYDLTWNGTRKATISTQYASFEIDKAGVQERLQEM